MADTTEMKIRKFRFLFQVHSWRYVTGFSLPSSKIDTRKNIALLALYSCIQLHASLPTVTITNQNFYHLIWALNWSLLQWLHAQNNFFSGLYKEIPFFRNLWVDTIDHYFSGPVKSVKTGTLSQKVLASKEIWPIFLHYSCISHCLIRALERLLRSIATH